jgi:DNA-binding CsgD family transcriptional regulator
MLACALYITKALDTVVFALPQSMSIVGATIIFLLAAAKLNDSLASRHGLLALKLCMVAGGIGSLATLMDTLRLFGAISAALFICSSILLYGSMLSYCQRRQLLWTTALSFVAVGFLCMLPLAANLLSAMVLNSLVAVAGGVCLLVSRFDPIDQIQRLGLAILPAKNLADKGNRFTLVAIGISVGAAMLMGFAVELSHLIKAMAFGGAIIAAAILTLVFRLKFKTRFEDLARRSIAVVATAAILPYSFVSDELKCLCVSVLLFSVTTSCIILIGAIAETARIKRISPFWITGYEGAIFMGGCLMAMLGLWYGLFVQLSQLAAVCIALVAAFIALQIFIENQTYPYFDGGAESAGIYTEPKQRSEQRSDDLFSGGGVRWRERMDAVATEHKLSPRQKEVMRLLLKGRDVVYIMNKFVISQATAKTHVYNLYKKLGVHSRHELLDLIEQPQNKKPTA